MTTSDAHDRPGGPGPVRLRDPDADRRLDRDGYVRIPFLDAGGVAVLRALWDDVGPASPSGIYSNVHDLDPEVNRRVDRVITETFAGPFDRAFVGARLGGSSFLVKGVGPDSASTPHQDWNNVEEDATQSVSIWVPLEDVDERNGALQVIPGSHRIRPTVRSLDTPSLYLDFTTELEPLLRSVPAAAGDAVVYAHNVFHGSKPNRTSTVRVCAVSGVVPDGARLVHYRRVPTAGPDTFEVLEVERDFYFSGIPQLKEGTVPASAHVVGRVTVEGHRLELDEVLAHGGARA